MLAYMLVEDEPEKSKEEIDAILTAKDPATGKPRVDVDFVKRAESRWLLKQFFYGTRVANAADEKFVDTVKKQLPKEMLANIEAGSFRKFSIKELVGLVSYIRRMARENKDLLVKAASDTMKDFLVTLVNPEQLTSYGGQFATPGQVSRIV